MGDSRVEHGVERILPEANHAGKGDVVGLRPNGGESSCERCRAQSGERHRLAAAEEWDLYQPRCKDRSEYSHRRRYCVVSIRLVRAAISELRAVRLEVVGEKERE